MDQSETGLLSLLALALRLLLLGPLLGLSPSLLLSLDGCHQLLLSSLVLILLRLSFRRGLLFLLLLPLHDSPQLLLLLCGLRSFCFPLGLLRLEPRSLSLGHSPRLLVGLLLLLGGFLGLGLCVPLLLHGPAAGRTLGFQGLKGSQRLLWGGRVSERVWGRK